MGWSSIVFSSISTKQCTRENLLAFMAGDEVAKRIHFATSHQKALKKNNSFGQINLPFSDSIKPILKEKLNTDIFQKESKYGLFWTRNFQSHEEYQCFEDFVSQYNQIVFLRDNLELSLALSMNYTENSSRTEIGELEYQAKYGENKLAETKLVEKCKEWLNELPFYNKADYICAMPSSRSSGDSFPKRIVDCLSGFNFENISDKVYFTSKVRSSKDAKSVEEKLEIMEESGLAFANDLDLNGKTILLFDDLYMSGVSMQYVAMKLKEEGARRVFGLSIVKSRSNTAYDDNKL